MTIIKQWVVQFGDGNKRLNRSMLAETEQEVKEYFEKKYKRSDLTITQRIK